ncbi:hypothetical protein F3Y22_tig00117056pilonHSYRG00927 [Hibiscus syriacus]|uniref:Uncharacterized protein n=1 Tax=Hibiscus syriacus TaxID=106335 RepID=A0A6A2WLD7_HIBSY|nr:GRAS family protein RAD1-like [Hibiscus syriacus]KAE8654120.1 hypothetical protein F3Y22_tig00117056pilonHSYRG00927 [Hibiscus syriacus]
MEAFQLLYHIFPCVAFGFMAANEAISQAAQAKGSLHITDLGMKHKLQCPSLIRTLASRPEGPPTLLITTLTSNVHLLELEAYMKSLIEDASYLTRYSNGVPHNIRVSYTMSFNSRESQEKGNHYTSTVMHLHKYVKERKGSLEAIKKLSPARLTVVEQDANHNGLFFHGQFLEALHCYSAIFYSLEASLPRHSPQRMKIVRLYFAKEIWNIIAYEGSDGTERDEQVDPW